MPTLRVSVLEGKVWLDDRLLPLTRRWALVVARFALARVEAKNNPARAFVSVLEVVRVPGWEKTSAKNAGKSLQRFEEDKLEKIGAPIFSAEHGEWTKQVRLNPDFVTDIGFVEPIRQVRLTLKIPSQSVVRRSLMATHHLSLAQTAFEQGRYTEVEEIVTKALAADATPDQVIEGLALWAWTRAVQGEREQALRLVQELQKRASDFHASGQTVHASSQALVWIQTARFHLRMEEWQPARRAYAKAATLVLPEDHRGWGALESGWGFLAQMADRLDEAEQHYEAALERFTLARWSWGIQVAYGNLCAVCLLRYEQYEVDQPEKARACLDQAIEWCLQTVQFSEDMNFGGSGSNEINLANAYRILRQFDKARVWLTEADRWIDASDNKPEVAGSLAARAELEEAEGNRDGALELLRQASVIFGEIGRHETVGLVLDRMTQLEGQKPMGRALNLW